MNTHIRSSRLIALLAAAIALVISSTTTRVVADEIRLWSIDKYQNIVRTQSSEARRSRSRSCIFNWPRENSGMRSLWSARADRDLQLEIRAVADENLPAGFIELLETIYLKNREGGETGDAGRCDKWRIRFAKEILKLKQ